MKPGPGGTRKEDVDGHRRPARNIPPGPGALALLRRLVRALDALVREIRGLRPRVTDEDLRRELRRLGEQLESENGDERE